jgi:hypothetical protein
MAILLLFDVTYDKVSTGKYKNYIYVFDPLNIFNLPRNLFIQPGAFRMENYKLQQMETVCTAFLFLCL